MKQVVKGQWIEIFKSPYKSDLYWMSSDQKEKAITGMKISKALGLHTYIVKANGPICVFLNFLIRRGWLKQ